MSSGSEGGVAWPLTDDQRAHIRQLGELIRRGGAARFVGGHLVRADARDFPEAWEPTLFAVHALLYRLFWHAYLDIEVVVDDVRPRGPAGRQMLRSSAIDLLEVGAGRATYQVAAIGNDDVAGLLSHTIGAAFVELAPAAPFREASAAPATAAEASIAACYLGLGVLVANAAMYRRYESRVAGRQVVSEQRVETTGGLSIDDATLLLAVQLVVRDDVPDARETLHGPQAEWIERWIAVLDPHEAELRELLGLSEDADAALPERPAAPRIPPKVEEAIVKRNAGRIAFRYPRTRNRLGLGLLAGLVAMIACRVALGESVLWLLLLPIGGIGGWALKRAGFACAACKTVMATELPVCPVCGIELPETLATREAQDARRAEWAALAEAADPELAAEAEGAYSDEV